MEAKNYTQVLIDGKIYTLSGSEDEAYLQKAASYVNEKNSAMRKVSGFSKQSGDYQMIMAELNIADDYFKATERAEEMERQRNSMEKETYSLKHELVSTQMKLEAVLKDLEERQRELDQRGKQISGLERELKRAKEELERLEDENRMYQTEAERLSQQLEEAAASMEKQPEESVKPEPGSPEEQEAHDLQSAVMKAVQSAVQSAREEVVKEQNTQEEHSETAQEPKSEKIKMEEAKSPEMSPFLAAISPSSFPAGVMTDEELARRALQAAKKVGNHKGNRRF